MIQGSTQPKLGMWIMRGLWLSGNILFPGPNPKVAEVQTGQGRLQGATHKPCSAEQISGDFVGHSMVQAPEIQFVQVI